MRENKFEGLAGAQSFGAKSLLACLIFVFLFLLLSSCQVAAGASSSSETMESVSSPDGNVVLNFSLDENGAPRYSIFYEGFAIVENSSLGIYLEDASALNNNFVIEDTSRKSVDNTWEPVAGAKSEIRNHYNQLTLQLKENGGLQRELSLIFRSYNDGVGFRYVLPEQSSLNDFKISSENTEFRFTGNYKCWWQPGSFGKHELYYQEGALTTVHPTGLLEESRASTPLTIKVDNDFYVAVHQADLTNYSEMKLLEVEEGDTPVFMSRLTTDPGLENHLSIPPVSGSTPFETPWRTMQIGEDPGDLVESKLIVNLNDPCALENTSWIQPGKATWNWLTTYSPTFGNPGVTVEDGFRYRLVTESIERFIELADWFDFSYVCLDAGWCGNEWWPETDRTKSRPAIDLPHLLGYAENRGAELGLYINDKAFIEHSLENLYSVYENWGIAFVKHGFMREYGGFSQATVKHQSKSIKTAAEHHLMYNVHESAIPSGIRRTYPNYLTCEAVNGNEFASSYGFLGKNPSHLATIPFTRMLAGPMDTTPGIFSLQGFGLEHPYANEDHFTRCSSTISRQLSEFVIYFSPLQHLANWKEVYQRLPEPSEFLRHVPTTWDDTKVLNAQIGDYVTIARKKENEWYVGSLTNGNARDLDIPLNFLDNEKTYTAHIYQDAENTYWENTPTEIDIFEKKVTSSDTITAPLKANGGQVMRITPTGTRSEGGGGTSNIVMISLAIVVAIGVGAFVAIRVR